jgi:hypothetical protein
LQEEADETHLLLIKDGIRCRVERDDPEHPWPDYDPERFRQVLAQVAGSWSDIVIANMYRWREEGSRDSGRPRP